MLSTFNIIKISKKLFIFKIEENKIIQMRSEYNQTNNLVKDEKKKIQREYDK